MDVKEEQKQEIKEQFELPLDMSFIDN